MLSSISQTQKNTSSVIPFTTHNYYTKNTRKKNLICRDNKQTHCRLQLKLEERELEKSQELDDLDLALLFQMLLQHFCVPRIILGAIGNRWGTKGLNFLLHEVFRCLHLGRPVLRASAVGLQ